MNILICDDLPEEMITLDNLLHQSGFPVTTMLFHRAGDALACLRAGALVDLCFLDIVMPDMSGIQLAQALRQCGYTGAIVFLSTSKEYGPESYTVDALSYVLKPPTANVVKDILNKLKRTLDETRQMEIVVKTAGVTKVIPHRRISHAEAMGHSVILHMTDGGELPVNTSFSEISAALLSNPCFIRCHRSYVVNMQDIAEISKLHITTHTNKRIPIPRSYSDTRTKFYQWKFGGDSSGAY